jgi:hypothetical protein
MDADALEAEVNQLKSDLTNVDVALSVPEGTGKNVLPYTLTSIKQNNSSGTWVDNAVTINGVTFTITASGNKVTKISATRVSASESNAILELVDYAAKTDEILSGCPSGGSNTAYKVYCRGGYTNDFGEGATIAAGDVGVSRRYSIAVFSTSSPTNLEFYPMIRPATITDSTFAPYIPSVDARLDAVESGLTNQGGNITPATNVTNDTVDYSIISRMGNVVTVFVSLVIDDSISAWNKLAELSAGFRPIHTTMAVGWMTTTSEPCLVRIGDDGNIMISKAVSTGKVQFSASYIVN